MATKQPPVWNIAKLSPKANKTLEDGFARLNQLAEDLDKNSNNDLSLWDTLSKSDADVDSVVASFANRDLQRDFDALAGVVDRIETVMKYTPTDVSILKFQFEQGDKSARRLQKLLQPCSRRGATVHPRIRAEDSKLLRKRILPLAAFVHCGRVHGEIVETIKQRAPSIRKRLFMNHVVPKVYVPEWQLQIQRQIAAKRIQRNVRGRQHRQVCKILRAQHVSARTVQKFWRHSQQRNRLLKGLDQHRRKRSAIVLQRLVRSFQWRSRSTQHSRLRRVTINCQALVRGRMTRQSMRRQRAVKMSQSVVRGFLSRSRMKCLRTAATRVQTLIRQYLFRVLKMRNSSAQVIQTLCRCLLAAELRKAQLTATAKVQTIFRGFLARQLCTDLAWKRVQLQAATKLQAHGRRILAQNWYHRRQHAAIVMQSQWRNFLRLQYAACDIQRVFRGHQTRLESLEMKSIVFPALTMIQSAWRRKLRCRDYTQLRGSCIRMQGQIRAYLDRSKFCSQQTVVRLLQPLIRGNQHRRKARTLRGLHNAARCAQKIVRGFQARKAWRPWLTGGDQSYNALFRRTYFHNAGIDPKNRVVKGVDVKMSPIAVVRQQRQIKEWARRNDVESDVGVACRYSLQSLDQDATESEDSYDDSFEDFENETARNEDTSKPAALDGRAAFYPGTTKRREDATPTTAAANDKNHDAGTSRKPRRPRSTSSRGQKTKQKRNRSLKQVKAWEGQSHLQGYDSDDLCDSDSGDDGDCEGIGSQSFDNDQWSTNALSARLSAQQANVGSEGSLTNRRTQLWFGQPSLPAHRPGHGILAGKFAEVTSCSLCLYATTVWS